jgi:hypothetical protein
MERSAMNHFSYGTKLASDPRPAGHKNPKPSQILSNPRIGKTKPFLINKLQLNNKATMRPFEWQIRRFEHQKRANVSEASIYRGGPRGSEM